MKKIIVFIFSIILGANAYSQIDFEEGYFVNNKGEKTVCLIKNLDWLNTPNQFDYKLDANSDVKMATIENVRMFSVSGVEYQRFTLKIDKSSEDINKLSESRDPEFKEETVFLKLLVNGTASLYFYREPELKRYFIRVGSEEPEQLIHKTYQASVTQVAINNDFRRQIASKFLCDKPSSYEIENVSYLRKELIRLFRKYNTCIDPEYVQTNKLAENNKFKLSLRPGYVSHDLTLILKRNSEPEDFGTTNSFRFGAMAEFILPFRKNKWSIIVEPNYQSFEVSKELSSGTEASLTAKMIEFTIGVKHNFFLNDKSKVFATLSYINAFSLKSSILTGTKFVSFNDQKVQPNDTFGFGVGYEYNDRYSFEFRYNLQRNLLDKIGDYRSEYKTIGFFLGYNLL